MGDLHYQKRRLWIGSDDRCQTAKRYPVCRRRSYCQVMRRSKMLRIDLDIPLSRMRSDSDHVPETYPR